MTRAGEPCRSHAMTGGDRCNAHQRPTADPVAVQQLMLMLRAGNYVEIAACAAGVTLAELLEHPELRDEIDAARAEGEVRGIARIAQAAAENWQAAAWLLERQYPDRWGRPSVRPAEDSATAASSSADGLDELAGKRAARRATVKR